MWKDENGFNHLTPKTKTLKRLFENDHDEKKVVFRHGHIAITNYRMGDNKEFEKSLSTFDEIRWKYNPVGFYYVKPMRELRINRGYDIHMLKKFFPNHKFVVDNDAYEYKKADIKLKTGPRDDFQKVALTFMAGEGRYKANKNYTQILIDASVGFGKTYCGVAISCFNSARVAIFVPFAKLLDQWKQSFLDFTSIDPDDIMFVQGSDACMKILKGKRKHIKVFLFMVDTISSFEAQYGPIRTMELLEATQAYMKIIDEVHLDIKAIAMVEALSNFRMNFYLSASPGRTASKENWIFKTLFYNVPKFGSNELMQSEKHLNIIIKQYKFMPDQIQMKSIINPRKKWLNTKAYETALFNASDQQRASFEQALLQMLNWIKKQIKPEFKVILFCNTIEGTEYLKNVAERVFPGECSRYYGTMGSKKEKEDALKHRVICATSSSLGTGADIKGLQFCINTCTYSSKIEAIQVSGRLRKLPNDPVAYIELVNVGWYKTMKQFEKRKPTLISRSRTNKLLIIE